MSTYGTLKMLYHFKPQEDPEDKVQIVVRDDFSSEKGEPSQAYVKWALGDYLRQVGADGFYRSENILPRVRDG